MSDATEFTITGRKIEGDISPTEQNTTPQISKDEFLELLDKVLSLPHVTGVIWDQYTPYFNDGDACVFGVNEPRIMFDFSEVDEDAEDGEEESELFSGAYRDYAIGYTTSELWERTNRNDPYSYVYLPGHAGLDRSKVSFLSAKGVDLEPYYDALSDFSHTASWERVALTNFGDHAEVTATLDGFSVETYEHD